MRCGAVVKKAMTIPARAASLSVQTRARAGADMHSEAPAWLEEASDPCPAWLACCPTVKACLRNLADAHALLPPLGGAAAAVLRKARRDVLGIQLQTVLSRKHVALKGQSGLLGS